MTPPRRLMLPALLAAAALAGACASDPAVGYAFNADYDQGIRTVNVEVFENRTFIHGIEDELAEAVIKEIHRATPWKVALGDADTLLTGSVNAVRNRPLGTNPDSGLIQEFAVELTVSFEWKDRATGEILVSRRRFSSVESFVPRHDVGERIEMGQRAAVQEMAARIVRELRSAW